VNGDQANNSARNSGAVYVYARSAGTWSQQAYVKASNSEQDDGFGFSVSISESTMIVGAFREDSSAYGVGGDQTDNDAVSSGAAYVFTRDAQGWSQNAYLKASNPGGARFINDFDVVDGDLFGFSVALSDQTIIVGAPFESSDADGVDGDQSDDSALLAGASYVFNFDGGSNAYDGWIAGFFPGETDMAKIGPFQDPNGDGIANAIAFVIDGSPKTFAENVLPEPSVAGSALTITLPRRSDANAVFGPFIEFSTDLSEWFRANDGENGVTITVDTDFFGSGVDRLRVSIDQAELPENSRNVFGRLGIDGG
ncbi:MAG: FG-GAP repeat protein, partial [Verrucomicrobiota bacterium]